MAVGGQLQAVAVDQVVGVLVRQSVAEGFKTGSAIVRAVDHHFPVDGVAVRVGLCRHKPGAQRIDRITGHGKTKAGWGGRRDALPTVARIKGAVQAAVVLHPQHIGLRGALHHAVRVLCVGVLGAVGRHVVGLHSIGGQAPGLATVPRLPHAATGDGQRQVLRVARVDQQRVHARVIVAATHPVQAARLQPQRGVQRPVQSTVFGFEQPRRHATGPQRAGLGRGAGRQAPHHFHIPGRGVVCEGAFRRLGRKGGRRDLGPMRTLVAALAQLDAKVPHAQGGVPVAIAGIDQHLGDRVTGKVVGDNGPVHAVAAYHEQAFAAGYQKCLHTTDLLIVKCGPLGGQRATNSGRTWGPR